MPQKTTPYSDRQKMRTNTYEIFRFVDSKPREIPLHHHDFFEVYFFTSGNVRYTIESKSYLLTQGDILLIRPMELHQAVYTGSGSERMVLWLNRNFLEQFGLPDTPLSVCFTNAPRDRAILLRPDDEMREKIRFLLTQLLEETESSQFGAEACCLSCLALLFSYLGRLTARIPQEVEQKDASPAIYGVIQYINEHLKDELSLDFLSNRFFISKYHLSREFARITGISVHRYIIQRRLILAKHLMTAGISSSEVFSRCGFGDYSNFYRAFKNEYGISPREFVTASRQPIPETRPRFLREK